jgi:polysaccharide export outer membrane protein
MTLKTILAASLMTLGAFGQIRSADPPKAPEPAKAEAPKANVNSTDATAGTGLSVDTKTYVIGPEDILFISVWREDTLTHQYGVRPDGKITVPLIKDVQAAAAVIGRAPCGME